MSERKLRVGDRMLLNGIPTVCRVDRLGVSEHVVLTDPVVYASELRDAMRLIVEKQGIMTGNYLALGHGELLAEFGIEPEEDR